MIVAQLGIVELNQRPLHLFLKSGTLPLHHQDIMVLFRVSIISLPFRTFSVLYSLCAKLNQQLVRHCDEFFSAKKNLNSVSSRLSQRSDVSSSTRKRKGKRHFPGFRSRELSRSPLGVYNPIQILTPPTKKNASGVVVETKYIW